MKKKNSQRFTKLRQETKLLWILILALVAIFFWIVVSILSPKKEQIISPQLRELAKPLTPTLDHGVLSSIPAKRYLEDSELESFSIFVLVDDELTDVPKLVDIVNQKTIEVIESPRLENQVVMDGGLSQLQQITENEEQDVYQGEDESVDNQEAVSVE